MFNFFNNQNNSNSRESSIENKNQSPYENESITNKESAIKKEGSVHSKSTMDFDTLQKARRDLVGEIQAIIEYDEHLHNTTNKLAQDTWENIKNEELNHVGELLGLLNYLDPTQKQYVDKGFKEFTERMNSKS